jgi:hypothetical protein
MIIMNIVRIIIFLFVLLALVGSNKICGPSRSSTSRSSNTRPSSSRSTGRTGGWG